MEIRRNHERSNFLLDTIAKSFKPRQGIHLSDLLYPKKAFWEKILPRQISNKEVQYFVMGIGHEEAMHRLSGYQNNDSKEWNDILYSMDFYEGHPIEMKTRRGWLAKDGEEAEKYESYLRQIVGYCACENTPNAELWVWSLVEKVDEYRTEPVLACYEISFTEEELEQERARLIATRDILKNALSTKDPSPLPDCPTWMCCTESTQMIEKPYCHTCGKEFATDWGINKHIESRTGKGHDVTMGKYIVTTLPNCRWYTDCKGTTTCQGAVNPLQGGQHIA